MQEYVLKLQENEIQLLLNSLAQQPYFAVAELIGKIERQCGGGEAQCM